MLKCVYSDSPMSKRVVSPLKPANSSLERPKARVNTTASKATSTVSGEPRRRALADHPFHESEQSILVLPVLRLLPS